MFSLKDKVIVVTGGNAGIGEGCVRSFAEEGAKVVFCARRAEEGKAIEADLLEKGCDVLWIAADVTDPDACKNIIDITVEKYGRVDGIVVCAGVGVLKWTHQFEIEEWKKLVDINFNQAFFLCKHALPHMMKNKYGSIVFISSATQAKPNPMESPYSAPKSAMSQLARHISLEYCRYGIRANTIAPGATFTPMTAANGLTEETAGAMNAAKKCAYPIDIANMARYLLAEESMCLCGSVLFADYGYACGDRFDQIGMEEFEINIPLEDEAYLSLLK